MRIRSFGAAALSALLCACGAGEPDFIESVDVPAAAVMDEFAALPS